MNIEIACEKNSSTKTKGDLLENLSKDLLEAQGYTVIQEIRIVGAELDLLCKHKVSGKEIYVECKAWKENIDAPTLRQLVGTVTSYDYAEGWLISTSNFGKEAKGFVNHWKSKPTTEASKLSFYDPETTIDLLQKASIICPPPIDKAIEYIGEKDLLGDWILLITSHGRYWTVFTIEGGVPVGILVYSAFDGRHINDTLTLDHLSNLESSLAGYDIKFGVSDVNLNNKNTSLPHVVEVQTGDSWDDYRPARPQDFIGRDSTQKEILSFLSNIKDGQSNTRIFAITGNSGLGKSSLIAKVRDRSRNQFHKNKYYIFAVDIRGSKTPNYIFASLLECLKNAQLAGFGNNNIELTLTNLNTPLSSPSIIEYLESLENKGQVICLIFDQFEELYSKPELFGVFTAAKDLMIEVASLKSNFALGFAWKTDSTTQQDHPAYHMWHELADYRRSFKLDVFDAGETKKSITIFEKEIQQKIPNQIRHQIAYSSQGFPWLLKKLCINLYENMKKSGTTDTIMVDFDVSRLFENDIDLLSIPERACLQLIAQKAPADWSEIIETSGSSVLNTLINKRLVVKSGDRLNIYWDIFKDFLLTKQVPVIPFNYIPTSDFSAMLKVSRILLDSYLRADQIATKTNLTEKTVGNIGADLVMFGIAERKGNSFKRLKEVEYTDASMLSKIREKFSKHSLKIFLYKSYINKIITQETISDSLKTCLPKATYHDKTWNMYSKRLSNYLVITGFLTLNGNNYIVQDSGKPSDLKIQRPARHSNIFTAPSSPKKVIELLKLVKTKNDLTELKKNGYRNAITILQRFKLITIENENVLLNTTKINQYQNEEEAIWKSAEKETVILDCLKELSTKNKISAIELGGIISDLYNLNWSETSKLRSGNALKIWANWIAEGIKNNKISTPSKPSKKKNLKFDF